MHSAEDVLTRLRFLQNVSNKSAPPHCHPLSILVIIISGGFVMVGLVMTIVAHWPGSVSVGFDPLRIPGPVVLSVSFVVFLLSFLLTFYLNRKEHNAKKNQLVSYAKSSSRMDMNSSHIDRSDRKSDIEMREMNRDEAYDEVTSTLLPKTSTATDVVNSDSMSKNSPPDDEDNLDSAIPEPMRKHQEKKTMKKVVKKKTNFTSSESGNEVAGRQDEDVDVEAGVATTTTTTVVKKKIKKKSKRNEYVKELDESVFEEGANVDEGDNGSLRVKIKTKPGTSVNISHV